MQFSSRSLTISGFVYSFKNDLTDYIEITKNYKLHTDNETTNLDATLEEDKDKEEGWYHLESVTSQTHSGLLILCKNKDNEFSF